MTSQSPSASLKVNQRSVDVLGGGLLFIGTQCSTCHFLTDNSLQSADKDQQKMRAVAEKPHDAVVSKVRYVSKCTAASRGPPCDSTALVSGSVETQGKVVNSETLL